MKLSLMIKSENQTRTWILEVIVMNMFKKKNNFFVVEKSISATQLNWFPDLVVECNYLSPDGDKYAVHITLFHILENRYMYEIGLTFEAQWWWVSESPLTQLINY